MCLGLDKKNGIDSDHPSFPYLLHSTIPCINNSRTSWGVDLAWPSAAVHHVSTLVQETFALALIDVNQRGAKGQQDFTVLAAQGLPWVSPLGHGLKTLHSLC